MVYLNFNQNFAKFKKMTYNPLLMRVLSPLKKVTVTLLVMVVGLCFLPVKGEEVNQKEIKIFPTAYINLGWQNPEAIFSQDLGENATFEEFNTENSAYPAFSQVGISNFQFPISKQKLNQESVSKESATSTPNEEQELTQELISQESPTSTPVEESNLSEQSAPEEPKTEPEKVLEVFNFSLPKNMEESQINNVQLRLSLAAKNNPLNNSKLVIKYQYKGNWQNLAEIDLTNEISNALNGGYFLYALPIFNSWQDLENLRIRFSLVSRGLVYLDAVWLEVDYQEKNSWESIENISFEKIKEVKSNFSNLVVMKLEKESGSEVLIFNLINKKIKKIGFQEFSSASDFPIALKDNFIFWLSKDKDKVFAFDLINEKYYQKNLPKFDPSKGERAKINFPEIPWTVIVDNFNFYFFSPETGEVFSDGNSEVLENFRQKFNLDQFLTKEKLSDLGFSVNWENE